MHDSKHDSIQKSGMGVLSFKVQARGLFWLRLNFERITL
jgi:hypothetical protein